MKKKISSVEEFMSAINSPERPLDLEIQGSLLLPYSAILPPGVNVHGVERQRCILSDRPDLGTIQLSELTITGQVQIQAGQIDIVACDARKYLWRQSTFLRS